MATESVKRIPGLTELFGSLLHFQDPNTARQAAENTHLTVASGIQAIGEVLWWASQHEDFGQMRETREALGDLGCLLKQLGEVAHITQMAEANAAHQLAHGNAFADETAAA